MAQQIKDKKEIRIDVMDIKKCFYIMVNFP